MTDVERAVTDLASPMVKIKVGNTQMEEMSSSLLGLMCLNSGEDFVSLLWWARVVLQRLGKGRAQKVL